MRRQLRQLATAAIGAATVATYAQSGDWHFSAGYQTRRGMDVDITGSSHVQHEGIHAASPYAWKPGAPPSGPSYRYDPGTPNLTQYMDRSFEDGFVFTDPGTADPNAYVPGLTWNWGYDNAGQYDADADTLSFHQHSVGTDLQRLSVIGSSEQLTRSTLEDSPLSLDDRISGTGLGVSADCGLLTMSGFSIRICGGLTALWGAHSRVEASTYQERVQTDRIRIEDDFVYADTHYYRDTYTYDTAGITPPAAPYAGTVDGPGPVIPNLPSSHSSSVIDTTRQTESHRRTTVAASSDWTAANRVAFDTDLSLYDVWLGPRIEMGFGSHVTVFAVPSISANYVDAEIQRDETFVATYADGTCEVLRAWRERERKGGWCFGTGMSVGVEVGIGGGWCAEINGAYDWVLNDLRANVGPNTVSLNAGGYGLGAGIRKAF